MSCWRAARRILCVRLDNMGDVLMTTPAMRALRQSGHERHLTLLTSSSAAKLAPFLNMVDDVWAYDAPWVKHPVASTPQADLDMIERLRRAHFDAAVIFTVYSQSPLPAAMMCRLAGIPLRLAHCRENPYELLTERIVESEPHSVTRHEVARQLALVQSVGAMTSDERLGFDVQRQDRRAIAELLAAARHHHSAGRWLVIHPGASASSRRWPAERFGEAGAQLARDFDGIAVTGSHGEQALVAAVCARIGTKAVPLAGALSLGKLAALIERADLLVANNTGPVHIAAAVGTPVVDLYALTNPQHRPWQVPNRVLNVDVPCRNCYRSVCDQPGHPCLTGVSPDAVVAAARHLLPRISPAGQDGRDEPPRAALLRPARHDAHDRSAAGTAVRSGVDAPHILARSR
ncbi:glycosyltransferase family 9 protein [Pandoraea nosoerga]|uniref:Glycosyl transferase n=1 Tax=Pandoraea nosoerga TaxID=2508296 RepID=A0A5E4SML8_9BURK|nr:glycosyltransferase family 9 protein [Pandoraea nosoerga]MBN4665221.1 glycosyltransferase family 9 protein [Pandoraea nosoerga]MBN4674622.1 glycosyltransferase family 9 protein [Pandoraea nosoerga]MBN4680510.1 glycosyltransferase family 9 protein [Pandoraea nosoerga]MBN4743915.1 glycosyltransferase family 9 protein [Pandoraea nosoerga]VVD76665.1 glycosyl transferase [Pandoraea nosoerga]